MVEAQLFLPDPNNMKPHWFACSVLPKLVRQVSEPNPQGCSTHSSTLLPLPGQRAPLSLPSYALYRAP